VITSAWQQVLTWRDMIRMNDQVPVPAGTITGSATTPLPRPAEVIEKLGLWNRARPADAVWHLSTTGH
jgi:DNA polymerase-1